MATVQETLQSLPGVTKVNVDFSSKSATCTIEPGTFDSDKAIQALAEEGFDDSKVKGPTS